MNTFLVYNINHFVLQNTFHNSNSINMNYIKEKLIFPFKATHNVSMDYRDRWSELPDGEYDVREGESLELLYNPGMGSLIYRKSDNTLVYMAGFAGNYVQRIN